MRTRCRGWVVADVLHHLLEDARRALVTVASTVAGPSDVDYVSYWSASPDAGEPAPSRHEAWSNRRAASAFDRPSAIVAVWAETAPAAVRAAAAADPARFVATQGHVLAVPDFLATLVTEAVVHHLDLTRRAADGAANRRTVALAVAVSTMDGLLSDEVVRPADLVADGLSAQGQRTTVADRAATGSRSARRRAGFRCCPESVGQIAMSTKRDRCSWAATVIVSVGPFRCLATMKSASPARGDSLS